jgi:hypothetical protein
MEQTRVMALNFSPSIGRLDFFFFGGGAQESQRHDCRFVNCEIVTGETDGTPIFVLSCSFLSVFLESY